MLVLSRRAQETVVLPNTKTTVQVLSVKSGVVRLGIEAPPEVVILRGELDEARVQGRMPEGKDSAGQLLHDVGAELTSLSRALGFLQLQLDIGAADEARTTLAGIQDGLRLLRLGLEGETERPPARPARRANHRQADREKVQRHRPVRRERLVPNGARERQLCGVS
jgi:carbon storage regulator CsrA